MTDSGSTCCGGDTCIGLCGGTLVGRHRGSVMTVDDIGHHAERWRVVEPWIRDAATKWKPGDLGFDLLNEIDRLRFLLAERGRAEPEKPSDAEPADRTCPNCGSPQWVSVSLDQGYTRRAQCVPCGAVHRDELGPGWRAMSR